MRKILIVLAVMLCASFAFAAEKYVKLGAIFAETGPASFLGYPEKLTAEMLVDEINEKGGINGYKIKLIAHDSQGSEQRAISQFKKLVTKDNVLAVIGPSRTGTTLALKMLADKYKVPLISCAASGMIVNPVSKYVFKTPQSDTHAVSVIYADVKKQGGSKVAIITAQNGFGKTGRDALIKLSKEQGVEIVADEKFRDTDKNMSAQLAKIAAAKPDAIICWGVGPAPAIVAKNAHQLGLKNIYMSHGVASKKFIELAGEAAEGIKLPAGRLVVADELVDGDKFKPVLMEYKAAYEKKAGSAVSTFGGHAYDAFYLFAKGFAKSGDDREKLAEEVAKIKDFTGTAGIFNMSADDHNGLDNDSFIMVVINKGDFTIAK